LLGIIGDEQVNTICELPHAKERADTIRARLCPIRVLADQRSRFWKNMLEPPTKRGQAMRTRRIEKGCIGLKTLDNIDTASLHNTHSFFCFCQQPADGKD
jgi:hypothetical protein